MGSFLLARSASKDLARDPFWRRGLVDFAFGQEEPVPWRRVVLQILAAGELLPGQVYFLKAFQREAGALKAIGDLERLPKVLLQSAKAELPEREIVGFMLAMQGGVLARRRDRFSSLAGAIEQQHRVVMHRVHRRQDAQEIPVRLQAAI